MGLARLELEADAVKAGLLGKVKGQAHFYLSSLKSLHNCLAALVVGDERLGQENCHYCPVVRVLTQGNATKAQVTDGLAGLLVQHLVHSQHVHL